MCDNKSNSNLESHPTTDLQSFSGQIAFLLYRKIARCKSSKYYESVLPAGTSVDFIFENYGPSSCTFLTIGTDLTEVNLEY